MKRLRHTATTEVVVLDHNDANDADNDNDGYLDNNDNCTSYILFNHG